MCIVAGLAVMAIMAGTGAFATEAVTPSDGATGPDAVLAAAEQTDPAEEAIGSEDVFQAAQVYQVTFENEGEEPLVVDVEEGNPVQEPEPPAKENYAFQGWQMEDGTLYDFTLPVTGNLTLYAAWEQTVFQVAFFKTASSDNPWKTVNVKKGKKVSKPKTDPARKGYVFKGWKLRGKTSKYNFSKTVKKDLELVGIWERAKPGKPKNIESFSSYQSIVLDWDKAKYAKSYTIKRKKNGGSWKTIAKNVKKTKYVDDSKVVAKSEISEARESYAKFSYRVYAVNSSGKSEPAEIKGETCVRRMYINVKLKINKNLTSHDGKNVRRFFPAGTHLRVTGSNGMGKNIGKYKFYYKGNLFFVQIIACKKLGSSANKDRSDNYSTEEAEIFVNSKGISSKTKYLIWVNQYDQHLYYFKGSKGKWKYVDGWEVSTGKNNTPTVTGEWTIYRRAQSRHGLKMWNFIKGNTALHGCHQSWRKYIGSQASGGCIRNYNENIPKIWKLPKHTKVLVH